MGKLWLTDTNENTMLLSQPTNNVSLVLDVSDFVDSLSRNSFKRLKTKSSIITKVLIFSTKHLLSFYFLFLIQYTNYLFLLDLDMSINYQF